MQERGVDGGQAVEVSLRHRAAKRTVPAPTIASVHEHGREAGARGAARILRGRRPRGADGRKGAGDPRRAGLRAQGDRAQQIRRRAAARARRDLRRGHTAKCPRARSASSRPTASRRACAPPPSSASLNTIDATCPLVTKVHREALKFAQDGYTIVLVGHEGHEEVEGTMGEAPERIVLVQDVADVDALEVEDPDRVAYVTQTTLAVDETSEILARLRERFPKAVGPRTEDICFATTNRQAAVKALAPECDLMLVIGSQQLLELAAARRGRARARDRRLPDRQRQRGARRVARRPPRRRHLLRRERAGGARRRADRVLPRPRRQRHRRVRRRQRGRALHAAQAGARARSPAPHSCAQAARRARRAHADHLRPAPRQLVRRRRPALGDGPRAPARLARRRRPPRAARRRARAAPRPAARRAGRRRALLPRARRARSAAASWCWSPATTTTALVEPWLAARAQLERARTARAGDARSSRGACRRPTGVWRSGPGRRRSRSRTRACSFARTSTRPTATTSTCT